MKRDLYFFISHIDDFEISCLSYLWKYSNTYQNINIIIPTSWTPKKEIWEDNLKAIREFLNIDIKYQNLGYDQRSLMTNFDKVKDDFYKCINFKNRFDIVTHDENDCHTDHLACNMIALGIFKYSSKFITIYSPSSRNFNPNFWIGMEDELYNIKKNFIDKYTVENEQSYTKLGYYIQSEDHYNIGKSYYIENNVHQDYKYYECFRILKEVSQ